MKEVSEENKQHYKKVIEGIIDACVNGTDGMYGVLLIGNDHGMMTVLSINSTKRDAAQLVGAAHEAMQNAPDNVGAYN
jgi:hypothetical protein